MCVLNLPILYFITNLKFLNKHTFTISHIFTERLLQMVGIYLVTIDE